MFVAESIHYIKSREWNEGVIYKTISSWSLSPFRKIKAGESYCFGIAYHLVEIIMDELDIERKDDEVIKIIIVD